MWPRYKSSVVLQQLKKFIYQTWMFVIYSGCQQIFLSEYELKYSITSIYNKQKPEKRFLLVHLNLSRQKQSCKDGGVLILIKFLHGDNLSWKRDELTKSCCKNTKRELSFSETSCRSVLGNLIMQVQLPVLAKKLLPASLKHSLLRKEIFVFLKNV